MAAVLDHIAHPPAPRRTRPAARVHLVPVGASDPPHVLAARVGRPAAATYRRRRLAVAALAVCAVVSAGRAAAALGGAPLAASGRRSPAAYVVHPGDSLWTVARHLAPQADPRPIVDSLERSRHHAPLLAGQRVTWPHG